MFNEKVFQQLQVTCWYILLISLLNEEKSAALSPSKLLSNETAEEVIKSDIFSRVREHCHLLKRLSYCLSLLNGAPWLQRRINKEEMTHTLTHQKSRH